MTTAVVAPAGARPAPGAGLTTRRPGRWPTYWPLIALFVCYPIWWAVGLANLTWPILAIPLLAQLVRQPHLRAYRGFGLWLLFVGWIFASSIRLEKFSHYVAYAWRTSLWIGAIALLLYVLNSSRRELPAQRMMNLIVVLWGAVVVLSVLALVLGEVRLWTPAQAFVPRSLAEIEFIKDSISPRLAEVQDFLGFPLARPAAPFVFTNEWGANMAVLTPVVIAAWPGLRPRQRTVVGMLAAVSILPMLLSVNRGLWVTIIGTFTYVAFRLARRRDPRAARRLVAGGTVLVVVMLLTPLGSVVGGRLEDDHSNNARLTLYTQVQEQVAASPLIGFGSPRTNVDNPNYPPVGTHGTFWLVLFSHGIPGAALFVAALGWLVARTWNPRDRRLLWLHGVVFAGLLMIPFYDLLPMPIFVVAACAGIVLRDGAMERA